MKQENNLQVKNTLSKRELKRKELENLIVSYSDNNSFDITKFRQENPKEYRLIPHYFGSINKAMEELNLVKLVTGTVKEGNKLTLKDALAYDHIKSLRDNGKTFEEISKQYGVSKMLVNRMFTVLDDKVKDNESAK